ncbi:MAG: hypothetical protein KDA84_23235, partial [Planctomycetaceae bacterium]|nr:hypothetical protein [Planctomycetaceae bacterium]
MSNYVELSVTFSTDPDGTSGLVYAPKVLEIDSKNVGGRLALHRPEPTVCPVTRQSLKNEFDRVKSAIGELLDRAINRNNERGNHGVERVAADLVKKAFNSRGLISILRPEQNPVLNLSYDEAASIPWEMLQEHYAWCVNEEKPCPQFGKICLLPEGKPEGDTFCTRCGLPMKAAGGPLALTRQISQLVVGGKTTHWDGGWQFLLVGDPSENLCNEDGSVNAEANQWARECREHLNQIAALLKQAGYRVVRRSGKEQTVDWLLEKIKDPRVAGMYFFGHGVSPQKLQPGYLLMADGEPLNAEMIKDAEHQLRFVFINACHGAAETREWSLEQRGSSVARAFARGERVV